MINTIMGDNLYRLLLYILELSVNRFKQLLNPRQRNYFKYF